MKPKSKSFLFYAGISFFFAFLGLFVGIVVGATFGGNYVCGHYYSALCDYSSFAGVRGYETTGIFGGMLGVFLGSCLSLTALVKLKKQKIPLSPVWLASFCAALLGLVFLQFLFIIDITDSVLGLLAFFFPFAAALFVFLKLKNG